MDWFKSSVPAVKTIRTIDQTFDHARESPRVDSSASNLRDFKHEGPRGDREVVVNDRSLHGQVERREDLVCALCGEMFSDPRLLPCLHSFCRRCLEHTINPRSTTLTCHLCRKETAMKSNGVLALPINFVVNNLLDMIAVQNFSSKPILCSICHEQAPATARCTNCMDFLCFTCHNAHSRVRVTKDHLILSMDQLKKSDDIGRLLHRPVYCASHPSEKVTYFCNSCQETICRECVVSLHQANTHEFVTLQQAFEGKKIELASLYRATREKQPLINSSRADIEQIFAKLDKRHNTIVREIHEHISQLLTLLKEKETSLISETNCVIEDKKVLLSRQLDQLNAENKVLAITNNFTEQVLANGTDAELLNLHSLLCNKLRELAGVQHKCEPAANDEVQCDTSTDTIVNAIENYGELSVNGSEFLRCCIVGDVGSAVKGHTNQVHLSIRNQHGLQRSCPKDVLEVELRTPESGIIVPEVREKKEGGFVLTYRTYSLGLHQLMIKFKGRMITGSPFVINVISEGQDATDLGSASSASHHRPVDSNGIRTTVDAHGVQLGLASLSSKLTLPYRMPLSLDVASLGEAALNPSLRQTEPLQAQQLQATKSHQTYPHVTISQDHQNHKQHPPSHHDHKQHQPSHQDQKPHQPSHQNNSSQQSGGNQQQNSQQNQVHQPPQVHQQNPNTRRPQEKPSASQVYTGFTGNRAVDKLEIRREVEPRLDALGRSHKDSARAPREEPRRGKLSPKIEAKFLQSFGRRGAQLAEFHGVFGLVTDQLHKRILATDCNNHRVQVFNENGHFLFSFGQKGHRDGEFQSPTGVGVGPNGEIIVCERLKGRIQVFDRDGHFHRRFVLNELKASTLTVDVFGRIIMADYTNCCIYILDPTLERWSKFGSFGYGHEDLQYPGYVATDSKGNIYVSDMRSHRVQMYDSNSGFIRNFGSKGDQDGEFLRPTGIAVDLKGRLIVADRDNHRIQVFLPNGEFYAKFGSKGDQESDLNDTHGLTVLSDGRIAAADFRNNRIQIFALKDDE